MKTYAVRAKRWDRGWELHIDGVGVTQSHRLSDAERMVRDYVSIMADVAIDSFNVEIVPEVGDGLDEEVREARVAVRQAEESQAAAARRSRLAAKSLQSAGLTGRDIAAVLRVSPQRVSQLLRDTSSAAS